jgi:thiamine biosynthesis lipoprotein
LYVVHINSIAKESNRQNKRAFDLVLSGVFLILSPFLIWFLNSKQRSLRNIFEVREADPTRIPALLERIGWQRVKWEKPFITLPEGMEIDFGGIGKEYAVDRVADWAASRSECPVLINFGGDLRCTGAAPQNGAWLVGIESIEHAGQAVKRIELKSGALASSGDARRSIVIEGVRYGHIFDARTGWPTQETPRSITVAAATCSQAGSYSTLAMLQGADAEAFLESEGVRYWCLR